MNTFTFTNTQIIIFALVLGLAAGLFGNLAAVKIQQWYWAWQFPPVPVVDPGIVPAPVPPEIGAFEQLFLNGEIARVNLQENYIVVRPLFPADAGEVKVIITPQTPIEEMKIVERAIRDFKVGQHIFLESKEDIRGKTEIELIRRIHITPPPILPPILPQQ